MQKEIFGDFTKLNQGFVDSAKRLGEINMRTFERLTERQLEATGEYLEAGIAQLKVLGETKDVQNAVSVQTKYATQIGEKLVDDAKKAAAILNDAKGELSDWFEDGMKVVAANPMTVKAAPARKSA